MKRLLIFLLMAILLFCPNNSYAFSDINSHWSKEYVNWAAKNRHINGYPDGSFKPNSNITNAEFYTIVNHFAKYTETLPIHFSDVKSSDWYYIEIARGVKAGYLKDSDGRINPNNFITRDEASRILGSIYTFAENRDLSFKDKDKIKNKSAVSYLVSRKIISGYPDGTFKPENLITRGEAAAMFFRAQEKKGNATKDFINLTVMMKTDENKEIPFDIIKAQKGKKVVDTVVFPRREGYTFEGYYLDKDYKEKADLLYGFNEDTTLYAKFKSDFVKARFYLLDERTRNLLVEVNVVRGKTVNPINIPELPNGYKGWYSDTKGENFANFDDKIENITDFYAIREKREGVKVTFVFLNGFSKTVYTNENGFLDKNDIPILNDSKWSLVQNRLVDASPGNKIERETTFYEVKDEVKNDNLVKTKSGNY